MALQVPLREPTHEMYSEATQFTLIYMYLSTKQGHSQTSHFENYRGIRYGSLAITIHTNQKQIACKI